MKGFCENQYCHNPGAKVVPVSVRGPSDQRRTLCTACEEAYSWGVQQGTMAAGADPAGRASLMASAVGGEVWHSGGGILLALLKRPDGRLVVISDDAVCEYAGAEAFHQGLPPLVTIHLV